MTEEKTEVPINEIELFYWKVRQEQLDRLEARCTNCGKTTDIYFYASDKSKLEFLLKDVKCKQCGKGGFL